MDSKDEFRFGLGHVTLEFLATHGGRFEEPVERLRRPADLARWLSRAGLMDSGPCNAAHLNDARVLREAIYRVVAAGRSGARPDPRDVELVNDWARRPVPVAQIGPGLGRVTAGPEPAAEALAQLARLTVELVTSAELGRVRDCARSGCSLLFVDRSRPGRRRWCSMERCGNRAKTARYRRRRRQPA